MADVINLETNRFESVELDGPAARGGRRLSPGGQDLLGLQGRHAAADLPLHDGPEHGRPGGRHGGAAGATRISMPQVHALHDHPGRVSGHAGGHRVRPRRPGFLPAPVPAPGHDRRCGAGGHSAGRRPGQDRRLRRAKLRLQRLGARHLATSSTWCPRPTASSPRPRR